MNVVDRHLLKLWAAVTIGALFALSTTIIVLLIFSIVGMPLALLLQIMPGIWVYLTVALICYALLRLVWGGVSPMALFAIAVIPPLAAGYLIPQYANGITEERIAAIMADDHGSPPKLPRGLSIAHAIDRGLGSPEKCWDICQRLLFSQTAASFVQVPLDQATLLASLPEPARRFSLGPVGAACNNLRLQASYAGKEESGGALPPPRLWDALPLLARQGLCIHDDAVRDARADVLVLERHNYDPAFRAFRFSGDGWRLSLHPIEPFNRREVFRRTPKGWTRLMRRTEVRYAHLATPLWLVPGFSFDTQSPTHLEWSNFRTVGSPIKIYHPTKWNGILDNDLAVDGLR